MISSSPSKVFSRKSAETNFKVGKSPLARIDLPPRVDKYVHLYIVLEVLLLIEDCRNEGTSWLSGVQRVCLCVSGVLSALRRRNDGCVGQCLVGPLVKNIRQETRDNTCSRCGPQPPAFIRLCARKSTQTSVQKIPNRKPLTERPLTRTASHIESRPRLAPQTRPRMLDLPLGLVR